MKKWYVVIVYSGKESLVKLELANRRKVLGLEKEIDKVFVPVVTVERMQYGKKIKKNEKLYSGYIFVKMELTPWVADVVRSAPNVFEIMRSNGRYASIPEDEFKKVLRLIRMSGDEFIRLSKVYVGDKVKVLEGIFDGQVGIVESVTSKIVRVAIKMFDRPTMVTIAPGKVEKWKEDEYSSF